MTKKLLLIDDNRLLLKCISFCAGKHKRFVVSTARTANQALSLEEREGPFDVIISNYCISSLNGIELLRRLQKQRPDSLRFLQSSCAYSNDIFSALEEGIISRFFPKPMMATDIDTMLDVALAHISGPEYSHIL